MEYQALHNTPWLHGSFWVFIAIVIFAVLAGRKIMAAINGMLDKRTNDVREALQEAARLKTEAEAMLAQAKAQHAQAMQDAKEILASAHQEAERMSAALAEEAEATAKRRERLALERIAAAEVSAVNDVRVAAIEIAAAASVALLRDGFASERDAGLVDQAIAAVPAALRQTV